MPKLSPTAQFVANQFHTRLANDGTAKAPGSTLAGLAPYTPLIGLIPGIGAPLAAGLTAANAISQNSAKNGSQGRTNQDASAAQAAQQQLIGVGNELNQRYQNASPGEQAALNYFFNRAGLGAGGNVPGGAGATIGGNPGTFGGGAGTAASGPGMGTAPGVNGGQPFTAFGSRRTLPGFQAQAQPSGPNGLVNGSLGIYNSPQYQLLRQQAEESVQHDMQSNQLGLNNQLAGRGIDQSSVQQGGQAAITAGANKSYADFTRQLAMNAADKQDQLVNQYTGASQPSLNSGATAGQLYGQGAGLGQSGQALNQQQSNLLNSLLGQGVQAITNYAGLGKPGGGGGGDQGSAPIDTSGVDQTPTLTPADTSWMHARGGPVDAGGMPLAAGGGKPHTTPIPTAMLQQLIDHLVARSAGQPGALPHMAHGGPVQQGGAETSVAVPPVAVPRGESIDQLRTWAADGPGSFPFVGSDPRWDTQTGPYSFSYPGIDATYNIDPRTGSPRGAGPIGPVFPWGTTGATMSQPDAPNPLGDAFTAFQAYIQHMGRAPYRGPVYGVPHRAQGGPVGRLPYVVGDGSGPELYTSPGRAPQVVGQHGPSLFTPPRDGVIIPNPADVPAPAGPLAGHSPLQLAALTHALMGRVC